MNPPRVLTGGRGLAPGRRSRLLAVAATAAGLLIGPALLSPGPATLSAAQAAACTNATPGSIAAEDRKMGTAVLPDGSAAIDVGTVQAYTDNSTVDCGQRVGLHLGTISRTTTAHVSAIRIGGYAGPAGRVIWTSGAISVDMQPIPAAPVHATTRLSWPTSLFITPASTWPPGYYLLKVSDDNSPGNPSWVPLVIRSSGAPAPAIVIASDLTQLAYNPYGGSSLYSGPGATPTDRSNNRAYIAYRARPLSGAGLSHVFSMDVAMARYLGRKGFAADWTSDSSLDEQPTQLAGHATVIIPGHSEYWTKGMYDGLTAEINTGTNLAVLGGNEIYWQARTARTTTGLVSMTVYRLASLDPTTDPSLTTIRWSDYPLTRDQAGLTGQGWAGIGNRASTQLSKLPSWATPTPAMHEGLFLPGGFGNEGDAAETPGFNSPANLTVLVRGLLPGSSTTPPVMVSSSYYSRPGGAGVFNAGVTLWICTISGTCPPGYQPPPAVTRNALDGLTVAALTEFQTPGAGTRHPSSPTPWIKPSILLTFMRASAARG